VRDALQPGRRAHLNHTLGRDGNVPALLSESEHFAALPPRAWPRAGEGPSGSTSTSATRRPRGSQNPNGPRRPRDGGGGGRAGHRGRIPSRARRNHLSTGIDVVTSRPSSTA
jgi:hypothetical protein